MTATREKERHDELFRTILWRDGKLSYIRKRGIHSTDALLPRMKAKRKHLTVQCQRSQERVAVLQEHGDPVALGELGNLEDDRVAEAGSSGLDLLDSLLAVLPEREVNVLLVADQEAARGHRLHRLVRRQRDLCVQIANVFPAHAQLDGVPANWEATAHKRLSVRERRQHQQERCSL